MARLSNYYRKLKYSGILQSVIFYGTIVVLIMGIIFSMFVLWVMIRM